MKKKYKIYSLETKKVCTPCEDYYHDGTNFVSDDVEYLESYSDEFGTLEEAESSLSKNYPKNRTYFIQLTYSFDK